MSYNSNRNLMLNTLLNTKILANQVPSIYRQQILF